MPRTLLLALLLLAGCATGSGNPVREPDVSPSPEVLRVLAQELPPFYYRDAEGEPGGFEHLILQSFAEERDLRLEVVWVEEFNEIFDLLLEGEGDVIASTVTITEERQERMDFSTPYFPVRVVLVERVDAETTGRQALPGKRVVTIPGTTYENTLKAFPDLDWVYVSTEEEMYEALAAGRADALATDSTNFLWFGNQHPELRVTDALSEKSFFAFVFRPDDPLRAEVDEHLAVLQQDGRFWTFLEQSFGDLLQAPVSELKADFLSP